MKHLKTLVALAFAATTFSGCSSKIPSIYKSIDEWKEEYTELTNHLFDKDYYKNHHNDREPKAEAPKGAPVAECKNGKFFGTIDRDVNVWRGVPYSKPMIGPSNRFKKATDPDNRNEYYEATNFEKCCIQKASPDEPASNFERGEDCLYLNVWNNPKSKKKPVLVYIHGGGWNSGGTIDPLYNGYYFSHYNPDVILVTITYRFNILGLVNLGAKKSNGSYYFTDYNDEGDYKYAVNNAIWDQVQALKYVHDNISAFGGDPNNVTVSGESAGGGAVSILCTIPEARQYFQKAFAMSGMVNQIGDVSTSLPLVDAIQTADSAVKWEENNEQKTWEGYKSIKELAGLPENALQAFWDQHQGQYQHPIRGVAGVSLDPFKDWEDGVTKDLIILQGHTSNEFRYYQHVFNEYEPMYDAICESVQYTHATKGSNEYRCAFSNYKSLLESQGYTDKEIYRMYADDFIFNIAHDYQAEMHAKNGGKGYYYIFDKGYDGMLEYIGAGHAVDCFYLFGQFSGITAYGNKEEVDLSRKYQSMVANFCKTGKPSSDWATYDAKTRKKMIINFNCKLEENPDADRVEKALGLFNAETGPKSIFRYTTPLGPVVGVVANRYPEVFRDWMIMSGQGDPFNPPLKEYNGTLVGSGIDVGNFKFHLSNGEDPDEPAEAGWYKGDIKASSTNDSPNVTIDSVVTEDGFEVPEICYDIVYKTDHTEAIIYMLPDLMIGNIVVYASTY